MKKHHDGAKVRIDVANNRIYITLSGTINKRKVEKIYTDIRFGVQDLQTGFDVITDLRECRVGHLAGLSTFKNIMDYLALNGVSRTIRVVGKSKIIFKQMAKITQLVSGYTPICVDSMEEAEQLLRSEEE